jgi:hypothetical protein
VVIINDVNLAIGIRSVSFDGTGIQPDPFIDVLSIGVLDGDSPPIFCRGLPSFLGIDMFITIGAELEVVPVSIHSIMFIEP